MDTEFLLVFGVLLVWHALVFHCATGGNGWSRKWWAE